MQIFVVILFFKLCTIQQKTVKPTYFCPWVPGSWQKEKGTPPPHASPPWITACPYAYNMRDLKSKERFLIGRNKTKRANFRCNHLFSSYVQYNRKQLNQLILSVGCQEAGGRKRARRLRERWFLSCCHNDRGGIPRTEVYQEHHKKDRKKSKLISSFSSSFFQNGRGAFPAVFIRLHSNRRNADLRPVQRIHDSSLWPRTDR